ncbi:GTPase IMAP family member 8-like [Lates japonicus]
MEKDSSAKELNVVILGSKSSQKYLVGNIILGRNAFDAVDTTFDYEKREGEVCERRVSLVKTPGWLPGYRLCDTPELFKTETILSVSLCPPGLHGFILVINAELPFKDVYKKATKEHLHHCFGEKVLDHTIVVFSHRGLLDQKTIEDHIRGEGPPLQSLLEACGNRYHVLCDDGTDNEVKVKQLFEKIDTMVAENSCYKIESTMIQSVEERRKEVDIKAEELRLKTRQQRQKLRNLLTEPRINLRVLMLGWVFSGKSAAGNRILSTEVFQSGERTMKVLKQSGKVAGREVIIMDTPGWFKFFSASFNPPDLKSEILEGVCLCSPSPNVILLAVPLDTSFTDEQRRVTEDNMRLLGQRVWRHVIVLFTFGDTLGNKTIEQHIESEGQPLRWLIEKCGRRYHVLDKWSNADDQVTELLEKMEEMVAGNSSFYLSETDDPQPEEDRSEESNQNKDEDTAKEITEQLNIEWDRRNWEKHQILRGNRSMDQPRTFSEGEQRSVVSEGEEEEMEHQHKDDQSKTSFGLDLDSEDDAGSDFLNKIKRLLEREWSRREAAMEHFCKCSRADKRAISEPDIDQLRKSREKVLSWLNNQHNQHTTSGYKMEKENVHGKRRHVPRRRKLRQWSPAGWVAKAKTRKKIF